MKRSYHLLFLIIFWILSCKSKYSSKDFEIAISIDSIKSEKSRVLEIEFKNNTSQNLIIPTLISYRKMSGNDQNTYIFETDQPTGYGPTDFTIVPYIYSKQVPSLDSDLNLHIQAKILRDKFAANVGKSVDFNYIKNDSLRPKIIFIKASSRKKLLFKIKPGIKGEYMISYYDLERINKFKSLKRGLETYKKTFSKNIKDYSFEYGGFKIDSLAVTF